MKKKSVFQVTISAEKEVDIYVPFVLIIEFIFHIGWLKVAEENL